MIFVTEAPNDRVLLPAFGSLAIPAPIPHGDFNFWGVWEGNVPTRVCGERKKLGDLINSISTGRYLAQWQAAREAGFEHFFLVLEGRFRSGNNGLVEVPRSFGGRRGWYPAIPNLEYVRLDDYLTELTAYLGVIVKQSENPRETVKIVIHLYNLFQDPPEKHGSLHTIYKPPRPAMVYGRPTLLRRVASELGGIGWERSRAVEEAFGTVKAMVGATPDEWKAVPGIGKVTAKRAYEDIRTRGA